MSGKKALNLPRRLEPLHDPLSSSGRLMGVFGPVVEALVLPMLDPGHDLPLGSGVALQLVRDEHTRGLDAKAVGQPIVEPLHLIPGERFETLPYRMITVLVGNEV